MVMRQACGLWDLHEWIGTLPGVAVCGIAAQRLWLNGVRARGLRKDNGQADTPTKSV